MNLRSIDLNLLVILDAMLDEAHVSRAADRVGLSQPAASSALQRCRDLFQDELLQRGRGVMRLTPKAEALRAPLKSLLADVATLVDPPDTPLAEIRQTLRLMMADHPASFVTAPLLQALKATAPGIDIVVQPWKGGAFDLLEKGGSDIAISVFKNPPEDIHCELLFEERYRVIMRKEHPSASEFSLERWLEHPHVLVSGKGAARGALDEALARIGRSRRVGVVVPSFQMALPLIAESDMIAMLPSRCIPADAEATYSLFEPPISVEGFPLHLAWHRRRETDRALQHVAACLRSLLFENSDQ